MAINNQIIGGNFTDLSGAPLANGYLIFELSQDEQSPTPGQIGAGRKIQVNLDNTGNVPSNPASYVFANDSLSPTNSFYYVSAYTASGQLVWGPQQQQVLSAPSPFNLSAWVPNAISGSSIGGTAQWGSIIGTLSNQTDLQNALNAKAPTNSPALTGTPTAPTPAASDSSTKIATTAFVKGASVLSTPMFWSRVYATDNSLVSGGLVNDGPLLNGVNLTNQLSATAYQGPGSDIMQLIASANNGVNGSWYNISNGDQTAASVGVRWRNIPLFTSRWVPLPNATTPANTDMVWFIGVGTDTGSGGTKPSISVVNCTATWFANIAVCGFYYRPSESANWQILASDGAGNSTKVITTQAVSTTLTSEFTYTFDGTTVTFYIDGNQVGTINTHLPSSNTGMCLNAVMGNAGTAPTALVEKFGLAYMAIGIR